MIQKAFGKLPVADITREMVVELADRQTVPSSGNYIAAFMRQVMTFAIVKSIIKVNPIVQIPVTAHNERDRVMTDVEVRAVWRATDDEQFLSMKLCIRMVMATGQRGHEVCGMRWAEIDRELKLWNIPRDRMKNHRPHQVPLSDLALSLLDRAETIRENEFVFPNSKRPDRAIERHGMTQAWARIVANLELDRCTPHDARRTASTNMTSERLGIPVAVVAMVLSHTVRAAPSVTSIYDRSTYIEPKRQALDTWAKLLLEIVGDAPALENVVELRGRTA